MTTGLDIAWSRPSISAIKGTGARFVVRYLSPDDSKNLKASEVGEYTANGLSVVVVWESGSGRMLSGYSAGVDDAKAAEALRKAKGLPDNMPIYFADDTDTKTTQLGAVNEYLRGVNAVIGLSRTGVYGEFDVIESAANAGRASFFWQTVAWSGGKWSSHANLRQTGETALSGSADIDLAMTGDYGQYPRPLAAVTSSTGDDDDMPTFATGSLPAGFGADKNGAETDKSKSLVLVIPPMNSGGLPWGGVYVSFAMDFGAARLRIAVMDKNKAWRLTYLDLASAKGRVNVPIVDGDQCVSVSRCAGTGDGTEPIGYLVEAGKR